MKIENPITFLAFLNRLVRAPADEGGASGGGGENSGGDGGTPPAGSNTDGEPPAGDGADGGTGTSAGTSGTELPETYALNFQNEELQGAGEIFAPYQEAYRELGLTQEQVDRLVATDEQVFSQMAEHTQTQRDERSNGWLEAAQADPELGKDWDLTLKRVGAGLEAAGVSEDEIAMLEEQGLTNMPGLLKAFARLGQFQSNDRFETGNAATDPEPASSRWYAETTPGAR